MRTSGEQMPQSGQQVNLDFSSPEEKRRALIQSIQRKRLTHEDLTEEERELVQILSAEERQDDQDRHGH